MNLNEQEMTERAKLVEAVMAAENELVGAKSRLAEFDQSAERFRYEDLDDAFELEWELRDRAAEDCEGSYNVGDDEYRQECFVGDKKYTAILFNIEYNRHDKRYYFIDGSKFRIESEDGEVHTA